MRNRAFFFAALLLFTFALAQIDRRFLKENDGFCLRTILGQIPHNQKWEAQAPIPDKVQSVLAQPFYYLAKGHQSYVFASADGRYVIKCYRFPSHLRLFPWLNHPVSYFFNQKRQKIMVYNEKKLDLSFSSYQIAFEDLQKETGSEWIHLHGNATTRQTIHLIDLTGNHYNVPLDQISFVIQKRFVMLFEALETMHDRHDRQQIAKLIESLISTITCLWKQGIIDQDPVLGKNYGWDGNRVVYIDIGRFVKQEKLNDYFNLRSHIEQITPILADWLQQHDPELLNYYRSLINNTN